MDPFIGQIIMFGGNFAPRGWAFCDGQLLPISQHSALFSILGTTYGGDGRTTFALPDLRGRVAIHPGNGPGLSDYRLGQKGGAETRTLTTAELPSHSHSIRANNGPGNSSAASSGASIAGHGTSVPPEGNFSSQAPNVDLSPQTAGNTGGGQPFDIRQPFLAVNFIIALEGVYPSRS
jgi:microcystin-dependent protein